MKTYVFDIKLNYVKELKKYIYLPFYVASLEKCVCLVKFTINFDGADAEFRRKKKPAFIFLNVNFFLFNFHINKSSLIFFF